MAPIKFEDNLREKLQERELQPKPDSWSKLAARLDGEMPQKRNNRLGWLAIAATMVGVLLAVTVILNNQAPSPQLVETEIESQSIEDPIVEKDAEIAIEVKEAPLNDNAPVVKDTSPSKNYQRTPVKIKEINLNKENNTNKETTEIGIAKTEATKEVVPEIAAPKKSPKEVLISTKINEVVAAIKDLQQQKEVTAEEIDALLAKAQREIANSKFLNTTTAKIDPNALLQDVETELERNFRDRVFDALGNGFNKVRTAVAERNY